MYPSLHMIYTSGHIKYTSGHIMYISSRQNQQILVSFYVKLSKNQQINFNKTKTYANFQSCKRVNNKSTQ